MRKISWIYAALGTIAIAAPAFAQTQPMSPMHRSADPAMTEMQRERGNPGTPSVTHQNQVGRAADAMGAEGVHDWLNQAKLAINRGQLGQANEFLERAESRLLTRSTEPVRAGEPSAQPRVAAISSAREALRQRNRSEAVRQIDVALGAG
ncbi:hypothetical protein [Roseococcus sp. YIM B11640]|uniref:hypothetical protein n=1 Tax=Roseococcus sp. YIM B11640 TaxID=3133973 RepID=UPI003C7B4EC2